MAGRFGEYYQLAKPGIIYGNALPAIGGSLLAGHGTFHLETFAAMLIGLSLVIGSGCAFNNYLDRGIDAKMERTKERSLVTGSISDRNALIYAAVLGVSGSLILLAATNVLTAGIALFGLFWYVLPYGYFKRRSVHGTLVGAIAGAVPPVVGYCSVTGRLDIVALLLFLILVAWQMPHFYAIALYRSHEYAEAGLPVLPVSRGPRATKLQMAWYAAGFAAATVALAAIGDAGTTYAVAMVLLGAYWLWQCVQGFQATDTAAWARGVFRYSLLILTAFCLLISLNAALP